MVRNSMRLAANFALALSLLVSAAMAEQSKRADSYPDIGIMNSVLDQLLGEASGKTHRSFDVYGSYLRGYGLLFVVTGGNRFLDTNFPLDIENLKRTAIDLSMTAADSAMKEVDKALKRHDSLMSLHESSPAALPTPNPPVHAPNVVIRNFNETEHNGVTKEELRRIDKAVVKFLESYADAENGLSPAEHVSVVLLLGRSSAARYYTVTRQEISNFRSGSETSDSFGQKVAIDSLKEKHESIDIMDTILEKAIGDRMPGGSRLMFGPSSSGIYLKGLGAFFVCKLNGLPDFREFGKSEKAGNKRTAALENRIVKTIGNYGSSLRFLRDGESVLVSLQLDRFGTGTEDILVGLRKKDIESYSRNEIGFEALKRRAVIVVNK